MDVRGFEASALYPCSPLPVSCSRTKGSGAGAERALCFQLFDMKSADE